MGEFKLEITPKVGGMKHSLDKGYRSVVIPTISKKKTPIKPKIKTPPPSKGSCKVVMQKFAQKPFEQIEAIATSADTKGSQEELRRIREEDEKDEVQVPKISSQSSSNKWISHSPSKP